MSLRARAFFVASLIASLVLLVALCISASAPDRVRAAPAPPRQLRVIVPAYFYPSVGSPWSRLDRVAARHPGLVWAIGNPNNGPGPGGDPTYGATFQYFQDNQGKLLGYVTSSYGAKPLSTLQFEIELWFGWYHPDGIFVDEMDNLPGRSEAYYHALYDSIRAAHPDALVVANPGTSTTLDYLDGAFGRCADVVCVFEDSTSLSAWDADPWTFAQPRREFCVLPYAASSLEWRASVDHAFQQNVGWFYATDDVLPNPWDTLPPYFEAMVGYIERRY